VAEKRGRLSYERDWLTSLRVAARRAGATDQGGFPRLLVRVDEFPCYSGYDDKRFGWEASQRFHDVMATAAVHYLMAVVPQWTHAPLDPSADGGRELDDRDRALLGQMRADGVTFGQHGDTHRTRFQSPRRRSELSGLDAQELGALLDRGRARLTDLGCHGRVFVAPFNRFDARQWPTLASRYDVITGGPESVLKLGFHGGPQWRGDAVYLPCYAPLYGSAATVLPAVESLIEAAVDTWVPIVLHTGWEVGDDFAGLERLATRIAPYAASWDDFLVAVGRSRDP
jgi:hypothetical protein